MVRVFAPLSGCGRSASSTRARDQALHSSTGQFPDPPRSMPCWPRQINRPGPADAIMRSCCSPCRPEDRIAGLKRDDLFFGTGATCASLVTGARNAAPHSRSLRLQGKRATVRRLGHTMTTGLLQAGDDRGVIPCGSAMNRSSRHKCISRRRWR